MRWKIYRIKTDSEPEIEKEYKNTTSFSGSKKPKDWEFMKKSGEILENPPDTWKPYAHNLEGNIDIISMEFSELMKAETREDRMHELIHLATACLRMWRDCNDAKQQRIIT